MNVEELFNAVEERLKEIAESVEGVKQVSVAETKSFHSPRVFVWIREGESRDSTITGRRRIHRWRFEYVVDVLHPDPQKAYMEVKRIHWSLYEKLMQDRTLGGLVLRVDPSSEFMREELPADEVIHFSWNKMDSQVFGSGLIRQLLEPKPVNYRGRTIYSDSVLRAKWRMEWVMMRVLEKYVSRSVYIFKDVGDEELGEKVIPKLNQLEPGQDFVTNREVEIREVKVDPRAKFEAYIEYLHNQLLSGLRTPVVKLFTTPGFTEASARAAVEAAEHHVRAIQRYVKRVVESEIFGRVLAERGFASGEVRLNWGMPERPELRFSDIHAAYVSGGITREEYRSILRRLGWPLEPDGGQKSG